MLARATKLGIVESFASLNEHVQGIASVREFPLCVTFKPACHSNVRDYCVTTA